MAQDGTIVMKKDGWTMCADGRMMDRYWGSTCGIDGGISEKVRNMRPTHKEIMASRRKTRSLLGKFGFNMKLYKKNKRGNCDCGCTPAWVTFQEETVTINGVDTGWNTLTVTFFESEE